jgi:predicted dehydrogenase
MEEEWKLKKARAGGGALIDPGIHLLDLVRYLIGEPEVVSCILRRRFWPSDIEDFCRAELACGAIDVTIEVTLTSWKNHFSLEIYGSDGMVRLDGRGGNYGTQRVEYTNRWFWRSGRDLRSERDYGLADPSFADETTAFLNWVECNESDGIIANAGDGCAALKLVEQLYQMGSDC